MFGLNYIATINGSVGQFFVNLGIDSLRIIDFCFGLWKFWILGVGTKFLPHWFFTFGLWHLSLGLLTVVVGFHSAWLVDVVAALYSAR